MSKCKLKIYFKYIKSTTNKEKVYNSFSQYNLL